MYDVVLASYDAETIYPVVQKLFGGQKFAEYPFYLLFLFSFFIFLFLFSFSFFFSLCFDTSTYTPYPTEYNGTGALQAFIESVWPCPN